MAQARVLKATLWVGLALTAAAAWPWTASKQGDNEGARSELENAVQLDSKVARAHYELGLEDKRARYALARLLQARATTPPRRSFRKPISSTSVVPLPLRFSKRTDTVLIRPDNHRATDREKTPRKRRASDAPLRILIYSCSRNLGAQVAQLPLQH